MPVHSIAPALERLRVHLVEVPRQVAQLSDMQLTQRMPGKWSRKEVLGHLIDSAINNVKRFTDATFSDGRYLFRPYDQNKLVTVNRYQDLPVTHLLTLWSSLNQQILFVTEAFSTETLAKPVANAQQPEQLQSQSEERSLAWLIDDYVFHLEHHLKTLL